MKKVYAEISHEREKLTPEEKSVKYSVKNYVYEKPKNI